MDLTYKVDYSIIILPVSPWYIQLYNQSEPNKWLNSSEWSDVSQQYSGLFFRVVDNNNNRVQSVQSQSGPVMDRIRSKVMDIDSNNVTTIPGQWSEYLKVGKSGNDCQGLRFRVKDQEIRPKNQAIRIWKREEVKEIVANLTWIDSVKKRLNHTLNNLSQSSFYLPC